MTAFQITFDAPLADGTQCLVPAGIESPHAQCVRVTANGAIHHRLQEAHGGQPVLVVSGEGGTLSLTFDFVERRGGTYPEAVFRPHLSRFTRYADALIDRVAAIAPDATGSDRVRAIACATAERFTYGHPEARFNDGFVRCPLWAAG